jgi:drug/metabolite transporter (DMT)-like permease
VLIATIFWAVENTISKRLLFTIEPRILAFGRMFFGSLFIMVYMLVAGISFGITMPQLSWILLSSAFLLLYLITWYSGLKEIKVTTATAILLLGSPITTLLSLFTGSALNIAQAFGALAVVCGAIFMISFAEKESYPTISTA